MYFFSLLGFEFGAMWGCFSDVFGLPYRLASLLIGCNYGPNLNRIFDIRLFGNDCRMLINSRTI